VVLRTAAATALSRPPPLSRADAQTSVGAVFFPAAERTGPMGIVEGIDLSVEMVRIVNEEARRRGLHARVRVMDAEHLAFASATFDRVLCGFGLMFFPQCAQALAECRRVLQRGGRCGISTWRVSQVEELRGALNALGLGPPVEQTWLSEPHALHQLLDRAGFTDVVVHRATQTCRYATLAEYWHTARGTGLRARLDTLSAEQARRVRAVLAERMHVSEYPAGFSLQTEALLAVARA